MFLVSTPKVHGSSRIEREYEMSDQRRYNVPCPHCGGLLWLKFERLRRERGAPETAVYACEHCEEPIEERHKATMLPGGYWRSDDRSICVDFEAGPDPRSRGQG